MKQQYTIKFRRNSKERYWEIIEGKDLYDFKMILESMLEKTTEKKLEIIIIKE